MLKMASGLGFDSVFLASTSDELATALMTNISLGRGVESAAEMVCAFGLSGSLVLTLPLEFL